MKASLTRNSLGTSTIIEPIPQTIPTFVKKSEAESMYERIGAQIKDFEDKLDASEEVGGRLVNAPGEQVFHIDEVGYWGPDMIIFHGTNTHGKPVQLMQHYSQLNLLLTALPINGKEARRIGFVVDNKET